MHLAVVRSIPLLLLLGSAIATAAQYVFPTPTPKPSPSPTPTPVRTCPAVNVHVQPGRVVREGQRIVFIANIAGGDPKVVPAIVWNVSAGTVNQGQDQRRIEVDTTGIGLTAEREIKADLWVGGYALECVVQASASVGFIPAAAKFGDFGEVDDETLKKNIETLSTYFSQSPDNLYLIGYAGRNSERGFTFNWLRRIRDELIASGLSPRRVMAVDGGFRETPLFDFWIVPTGAQPPRAEPTIDRRELFPPKTAPSRKP